MTKFHLTREELIMALVFVVLGRFFSQKSWLMWLNSLTPLQGVLVYYGILFLSLIILSHYGLAIGKIHIGNWHQVLGVIMITFAFFIIFNWENQYVQITTMGCQNANSGSHVFYQSEDGVTFDFWYNTMHYPLDKARLYTYEITPAILAILGGILATRPKLNIL